MKNFLFALATLSLLMACTPEENNPGNNNGNDGTVHVTGISLDRTSVTIKEGESVTLVATVTPNNAANKNVTWSSSSDAVATVDNNGKVTGVKAGSATITATTEDGGKKVTCALSVEANDGTVHEVISISLDRPLATIKEGESITLVAAVIPLWAKNRNITWTTSSEAVATVDNNGKVTGVKAGNATITATTEDGGKKATCVLIVRRPYTAVDGEAVDLGLSVKWSSTNLGAMSPTDYGDYFAWGETAPKDNYNWETYDLCNDSTSKLIKYNTISSFGTVDNKKEFKDYDYEDDAARQALGGSWRMPTEAEWTELLNNCTWTWVENYNGSGINGQLVTSKTNSNSIFLPAGGGLGATFFDNGGSKGYFWSSSIDTGYPYSAWGMRFCYGNTFARCYGLSVRPVSE